MSNFDTPQPGVAPATGGSGQSVWSRIGNVFVSPVRAFEGCQANASIIVTLLILTVVLSIVVMVPAAKYQGLEQVRLLEKSTTIPPQYFEEMRRQAEHPNLIRAAIVAPIVILLMGMVSALIAWMFGGFFLGGRRVGFGTVWSVELLGGLIALVGGVIKIPFVLMKESVQVSFGPAALLSGMEPTSIFFWLMSYLDLFAVWSIIVIGIGYASIFEFGRGKGITISAISWAILIAIMIGMQVFGLAMAGVEVSFF